MGPIGHFAVGLAAKPVAPKVSIFVLLVATVANTPVRQAGSVLK